IAPGDYSSPRISPDSKHLAVYTDNGKDQIILIYDLNGATPIQRLTFEGRNRSPLWTDDQHILFTSERESSIGISSQRSDGGPAEQLASFGGRGDNPQLESWSPNEKVLIFTNWGNGPAGAFVSMLSVGANEKPKVLIKPRSTNASLSSDGRWLAYQAGDHRNDIYVEPFPPSGEKHQITTDGGDNPLWSPDGR